jgi:methyl-accepting chemotaxis protein
MFGNSLQVRFAVPVSIFILLVVLGGAITFSSLENKRISREQTTKAEEYLNSAKRVLNVTDALVSQQTHSSMNLLMERGQALGAVSLGTPTSVKDKTVPNLMLGGKPQANNFELVDGIVKLNGGTATLFVKSGDDFVRISTNVKKDNERATGTILDPKGRAIAAIREGKAFYGLVDILGNPFITGYEPIRDAQSATIGIWYVGYKIDMAALKDAIENTRLLNSGFMAIVDANGKVRFRSSHVSDEQVSAVLADNSGWVVKQEEFAPWHFRIVVAYPIAEAEQVGRDSMFTIIATGIVVSIVLIAIMIFMLRRMVLTPLGGEPTDVVEASRRIANGDLRTPIRVAAGDNASMVAAMEDMRRSLVGIVGNINAGINELNDASSQLASMADRVSEDVTRQNDATSSIAAMLEEMSTSIHHVSDSTDAVHRVANQAGGLSGEGQATVSDAVAEMRSSAASVNESAASLEKLDEDARKISTIVNVIKEIADQTNLLALNAAIEAARAGEAGRGFAVVADEVRKLAERTSTSTREITTMIEDIQSSTANAIEGIRHGAERVNESVERANQAGDSMIRINEATNTVVTAVREIAHALREQASTSDSIASNVGHIAEMNTSRASAVHRVVDNANRLQKLAVQLNAAVDKFRV